MARDEHYPGDCELTQFLRRKAEAEKPETELTAKAARIRLLLLDVDGVLTDGSIPYTASGEEIKTFNSRDGFGLNLLRKAGIEVGLITARKSEALARRAADLGIVHLHQGARHKVEAFSEISQAVGVDAQHTAFMGDDWLDLPLLGLVGLAATVADAVPEVKEIAHLITINPGGRGAVREVCDFILQARGLKAGLLAEYITRR